MIFAVLFPSHALADTLALVQREDLRDIARGGGDGAAGPGCGWLPRAEQRHEAVLKLLDVLLPCARPSGHVMRRHASARAQPRASDAGTSRELGRPEQGSPGTSRP